MVGADWSDQNVTSEPKCDQNAFTKNGARPWRRRTGLLFTAGPTWVENNGTETERSSCRPLPEAEDLALCLSGLANT